MTRRETGCPVQGQTDGFYLGRARQDAGGAELQRRCRALPGYGMEFL